MHQTDNFIFFLTINYVLYYLRFKHRKNSRQVPRITIVNRTELLGWLYRRGCLLDDERNILSLLALLTFISRLSSFPSQITSLPFYHMFDWTSIIIIIITTNDEDGISNRNN